MSDVKFPQVQVKLVGEDGNAFSILGRVVAAMRKAKLPTEAIDEYRKEAMSGDYNALLCVTMATVSCDMDDEDEEDEEYEDEYEEEDEEEDEDEYA